jgi:hypothetical protein
MKRISKKTLVVALVSFGVCVVSTGAFFGVWWWVNHLEQRLHDTKVSAKRAEDERRQYASLAALAGDTAEDRARLETYIVSDSGVIGFLAELEQIAGANAIVPTTRTISTVPLAGDALFEELVVAISLVGSQEGIKEVLRSYERMPYQVRIESAVMRGTPEEMSAEVTVRVTKFKPT